MGIQKFPDPKDGGDNADYTLNWANILPTGDKITGSIWVVPTGLTGGTKTFTDTTTVIWLSGGTEGQSYTLTNTITTQGGRTFERDVILKVKNL